MIWPRKPDLLLEVADALESLMRGVARVKRISTIGCGSRADKGAAPLGRLGAAAVGARRPSVNRGEWVWGGSHRGLRAIAQREPEHTPSM